MSTPKDDGGPAFPHTNKVSCGQGISMRQWFAGKAIEGCASGGGITLECKMEAARDAFEWADAMVAAGEK